MRVLAIFVAALPLLLAACALRTPVAFPGLEGTHWHLVSVSGKSLAIPKNPPVQLRFIDSRVNFHACNPMSGRYSQEGNHIVVTKGFVGTKMMCEPELMKIDTAAAELFRKGVRFTLFDGTLVLQSDNERWAFARDESATVPATDDTRVGS